MRSLPTRTALFVGTVLVVLAMPFGAAAQANLRPSADVGLGLTRAGHGFGLGGKFSLRATPGAWGIGLRLMVMDGAKRTVLDCSVFCAPRESLRERSVLVYRRIDTPDGARVYLGAGVSRLSGRKFIGSSANFDRNVLEYGASFEASYYFARTGDAVSRFATTANGHIGQGGVAIQLTIGFALSR
jgi:hypothetical protein